MLARRGKGAGPPDRRYLFYLGHPAHFHLFRHVISTLKADGCEVAIVIKRKDVLEALLDGVGWTYHMLETRRRSSWRAHVAWRLVAREVGLLRLAKGLRPSVMVGTSAEIAHVGRILGIPSLVVNEDDWDVVPGFAYLAYPLADLIVSPVSCRVGRWAYKRLAYHGFHELAYLHPNHFTPNAAIGKTLRPDGGRYFILRFAALNAYHDRGRNGIGGEVAARLVKLLTPHGRVYITSERPLEPHLEQYRIRIDPLHMHDALFFADLYVGDSQTMAAEAAVLGTPSVRYNDFVGQIGYLDALEQRYELTYGIPASQPEQLYEKVGELIETPDLNDVWQARRHRMLSENGDLANMLAWLVRGYPGTVEEARRNPKLRARHRLAE